MAEDRTVKRPSAADENDGSNKKLKLEEPPEPRDPGKKNYREIKRTLKQLASLAARKDMNDEVLERIRSLVKSLVSLVTSTAPNGETENPLKLFQIHLKHALFNSKALKDGDNIKDFLNGLEDCSAIRDDGNDSIYVFLANNATELWYQWDEELGQWKWTPESEFWLWMPCSTNVVTAGKWEGEVPALENVEIINYLNAVRPVPSDEQYLPSSYDVLQILQQVLELKDEELMEGVKKIAVAMLSLDCVPSRDINLVKEVIEMLEKMQSWGVKTDCQEFDEVKSGCGDDGGAKCDIVQSEEGGGGTGDNRERERDD